MSYFWAKLQVKKQNIWLKTQTQKIRCIRFNNIDHMPLINDYSLEIWNLISNIPG